MIINKNQQEPTGTLGYTNDTIHCTYAARQCRRLLGRGLSISYTVVNIFVQIYTQTWYHDLPVSYMCNVNQSRPVLCIDSMLFAYQSDNIDIFEFCKSIHHHIQRVLQVDLRSFCFLLEWEGPRVTRADSGVTTIRRHEPPTDR